jgi:hypothetical protein
MMMTVEQAVKCVAGESKLLGDNLPHGRFMHHKSHMT